MRLRREALSLMSVREVHYIEFDCTHEWAKQNMIGYETVIEDEIPVSPSAI